MSVESADRIRVVTVGGGTGSSVLLRGLKRYADRIDITAIVTTFDDGGSSGRLRNEFGVPALGDLRRCIAALLPENLSASATGWMLEHRFTSPGQFHNHSLGNLMLLGLWQKCGSLSDAIDSLTESLGLCGRVIAVSYQPTMLCAEIEGGTVICGEAAISARSQAMLDLAKVYLDPSVPANPAALEAIRRAHVVILGPGDLFTSVIPNLLPEGISDALQGGSARILQICNTVTRVGETDGYSASDFVATVNRYLNRGRRTTSGSRTVDAIIVNEFSEDSACLDDAVTVDDRVYDQVENVLVRSVSDASNPSLHDPDKLASAVMEYVGKIFS